MILRPYFPLPDERLEPVFYAEWRDQYDMTVRGQRLTDYAARTAPKPALDFSTSRLAYAET